MRRQLIKLERSVLRPAAGYVRHQLLVQPVVGCYATAGWDFSSATAVCIRFDNQIGCHVVTGRRIGRAEKSNAIVGAVTTGYECLPPSCDGLTGLDDHGPMISRLIDRGGRIESLGLVFVVTVAQKYKDARASGNTALSSPCWDLLATMRRVVNYHSSWARQQQVELFDASGIRV
ncbi:L-type lectin-domain containing receptor kinase I.9-like [Dorcoceras hygrometricum]|uniref:L-type lectin-domain containing receptor kinase I.9-like n=1 Tax=Dorcoceras hygrometricum TaxID=472368 RepID=A0A2Z7B2E9_9LAMI|nr:L-type lectin-domain containing receptor kinase I.9-like [Dorcoceras hygrometricum]